jgi:hypothetical protein
MLESEFSGRGFFFMAGRDALVPVIAHDPIPDLFKLNYLIIEKRQDVLVILLLLRNCIILYTSKEIKFYRDNPVLAYY